MTRRTTKQKTLAEQLLDQGKEHYTVPEIAPALAEILGVKEVGARSRIYRAVDTGKISARSYLGAIRIPYAETARVLRGDDY